MLPEVKSPAYNNTGFAESATNNGMNYEGGGGHLLY